MSVRLCRVLQRVNKRLGGYEKKINNTSRSNDSRSNMHNTYEENIDNTGVDERDMFDGPLKKNSNFPSYVQPKEVYGKKKNLLDDWKKDYIQSDKYDQYSKRKKNTHLIPMSDNYAYNVPYNFKIVIPSSNVNKKKKVSTTQNEESEIKEEYSRNVDNELNYTDYSGFRNPTLETFNNYRYWQDSGFKKFLNRIFPIKLPEHKKVDPLLREYIYFLHSFDPYRFTFKKISERYYFSENSIRNIYKEESVKRFLQDNQLCDDKTKRISKREAILQMKELIYSKKIGYQDIGDYENIINKDEPFQGYKNTFDQIKRQVVEVESISSFPLPDRRDPVPKRVDVDIPVFNTANVKIMNWVNPNDKVIF
ncbi:conserved protein, unknown function [Hepatocystis sp. ex Piliocolobus tephrosceles]|nr:conserved protein, unknown function [Hepatocystis sp. ex Piliocolobus tephrosceles]